MRPRYHKRHPVTGVILGAMSGLAGTVIMTQFQNVWNSISANMHEPRTEYEAKSAEEPEDDSTMKAAGKLSKEVGVPLSRQERQKAGLWVHYAFGTSVGAVFGVAAEMKWEKIRRINPALAGAVYGAAVFVAAHEIAVPALKLSSNPLKEPIPEQIAEFVSHLVYGAGTALTYDVLKRLER